LTRIELKLDSILHNTTISTSCAPQSAVQLDFFDKYDKDIEDIFANVGPPSSTSSTHSSHCITTEPLRSPCRHAPTTQTQSRIIRKSKKKKQKKQEKKKKRK
jgi:hypothetical protein